MVMWGYNYEANSPFCCLPTVKGDIWWSRLVVDRGETVDPRSGAVLLLVASLSPGVVSFDCTMVSEGVVSGCVTLCSLWAVGERPTEGAAEERGRAEVTGSGVETKGMAAVGEWPGVVSGSVQSGSLVCRVDRPRSSKSLFESVKGR